MNYDIVREFVYRFPGEDALEVAMQVAKEVEEEMDSYGKVSFEKEKKFGSKHKSIPIKPKIHLRTNLAHLDLKIKKMSVSLLNIQVVPYI